MLKLMSAVAAIYLAVSAPAFAQGRVLTSIPAAHVTVTEWYKQSVYDPNDKKIGTIGDVLVDTDGKIGVLILGVGGFVGVGTKNVAVPFGAVKATTKNNKTYLVMESTKEELQNAPGFTYDRTAKTWKPETKPDTPPGKKK